MESVRIRQTYFITCYSFRMMRGLVSNKIGRYKKKVYVMRSMKRDHKSTKLILQESEKTDLSQNERFLVWSRYFKKKCQPDSDTD